MSPQERTPGRAIVPVRGGRDAVASQNLADGGSGDPMAQTPQLALDPGVAPRRIVAGQLQDQLDEFLADRRCGCRLFHPRRSGSMLVLVQDAAEAVASSHVQVDDVGADRDPLGRGM